MSLGKFIQQLRVEKKYSQRKLALLSDVSNTTISRIEADSVTPDIDTLTKIANALKVDINLFIQYLDDTPTNRILDVVKDDSDMLDFAKELAERESMQLLFKQVKPLSDDEIARVMRIIKAIEDEEDRQDGV